MNDKINFFRDFTPNWDHHNEFYSDEILLGPPKTARWDYICNLANEIASRLLKKLYWKFSLT